MKRKRISKMGAGEGGGRENKPLETIPSKILESQNPDIMRKGNNSVKVLLISLEKCRRSYPQKQLFTPACRLSH